jgi:hypothetical protein
VALLGVASIISAALKLNKAPGLIIFLLDFFNIVEIL